MVVRGHRASIVAEKTDETIVANAAVTVSMTWIRSNYPHSLCENYTLGPLS